MLEQNSPKNMHFIRHIIGTLSNPELNFEYKIYW